MDSPHSPSRQSDTEWDTMYLKGLELEKTVYIRGKSRNFWKRGPRIYKILEKGGPKPLKTAFECLFQSFSYKFFANIHKKGGGGPGFAVSKFINFFYDV